MFAPSETRPDAPTQRPIPLKIVISGGFGVGKTTFVGALSDIEPLTTEAAMTTLSEGIDDLSALDHKTTTTVAMDFGRVAVDASVMLYLFGTPGQDRFGFMWNDLVDGALGAVVLVDCRRIEDSFPALDYFESRDMPFIVAVNRFDGRVSHSADDVRNALSVGPNIRIVTTDARERDAVKDTVLHLLDVVYKRAVAKAARNGR